MAKKKKTTLKAIEPGEIPDTQARGVLRFPPEFAYMASWEEVPSKTPSQSEVIENSAEGPGPKDEPCLDMMHKGFSRPPAISNRSSGAVPGDIVHMEGTSIALTNDHDFVIAVYSPKASDTRPIKFLVSRNTLTMASSVFKQQFKLSIHQAQENFIIYSDHPESLHIVLRILHFDIHDDLLDISFSSFAQVAKICEKYTLQRALRPWSYIWLGKYTEYALQPGFEDWVYLAPTFGTQEKVEELISLLAKECTNISNCGTYVLRHGKEVLKTLWPCGVLDRILMLRIKEINRLTLLLKTLTKFLKHPTDYQKFCNLEFCVNLACGSWIRSLEGTGLSRLLEPGAEWHGSVQELQDLMNGIKIDTLNDAYCSHKCSLHVIGYRFTVRIAGEKMNDRECDEGQFLDSDIEDIDIPPRIGICGCINCR